MEEKGINLNSLKIHNRSLLLNLIRKHRGISRIELARMSGLTKGGITPIISDFLKMDLIRECGTYTTSSGRRPIGLEIVPERLSVIALDFKRLNYYLSLINFAGDIVYFEEYTYQFNDTFKSILDKILNSIEYILTEKDKKNIIGIGITAPGPLDFKKGIILCPPNFLETKNVPIKNIVEERFGIPAYLDNNANAYAIAEKYYGSAKEYSSFIYLSVDEGVGAGIMLKDELYRGRGGFGSELGHTTINMNGPQCSCGNYGCVEVYASVPSLLKQLEGIVKQKNTYSPYIEEIMRKRSLKWDDFLTGLNIKDTACIEILQREARYLSNIVVTASNLLEPQAIIIGSQLAECGELIIKPLKNIVYKQTATRDIHLPAIHVATTDYGALIGGATMVINHFIDGNLGKYEEII